MKKHEKVFAIFIMLLFLLPNAYIILVGKESYPFTPAPMFGHYIGDSTYFYEFQFIPETDTIKSKAIPDHAGQLNTHGIKRFFFDRIYWSVEPGSPLGDYKSDTKEKLEYRLSEYCTAYIKYLVKDTTSQNIRLVVNQYNRTYKYLDSHTIGHYNLSTKKFYHTWKER